MIETGYDHLNKLLAILKPEDQAFLAEHLEPVTYVQKDEVERPGTIIESVIFPETGLLSVVAHLPEGRDIEVGIVGRDGMSGTGVVQFDEYAVFSTFVQIEGRGLKLDVKTLRVALAQSISLNIILNRYARSFAIQIGSTALANGRSRLEERLARWLVMVQDRIDSDKIAITHEFLSIMLGVRRSGVTDALHILEGRGLVRANRGEIIIRDREGLIVLGDGAYGMAELEYQRIMGMPS
ncbi:Crp/Fnr family transcriptional regulator [Devosia rhodophyticola]|uniref:Crp/Fnr family transcriptional regulator n=1 Tax=Devosia rhodophyticola TaxID=3026423 RepID=A0ABY7Z113_9HYPH|nr:Crp/Fnr family transcriptional regulator [Devosia rhodophyticola]WDR07216.1 Crp/Fnr family transcriptional regulator [Devosia rhodophyticola]